MQKFTLTCLSLFLFLFTASAQSREGSVTVNKKQEPAIVVDLPFSASTAEDAIKSEMKKKGHAAKESKGFMVYKDVLIPEISKDRVDLYIKTERRSRKEKDASIVYVGVAKGSEQFIGRDVDPALFSGTRAYADQIHSWSEAHALELDINSQDDVLKKTEKKYQSLIEDSTSLSKKKLKIEQDILENKSNLSKQTQEIEAQKKILENLRARRKN